MKNFSFRKPLLSLLTALTIGAIPGAAFADICDKVDFRSRESVINQVQRLVPGSDTVTAKDAACVLGKIRDNSVQENVGIYLGNHLENPAKLDTMLDAVKDQKTRDNISRSVKKDHHNNAQNSNRLIENVCGKIIFDSKKANGRSVYVQVKDIVKNKSTIRSSDVACIIKDQTKSQQKKVTEYLVDRLEDPQNYEVISKVFIDKNQRESFEKAVKKNYTAQQLKPVPAPAPEQHPVVGEHVPRPGNNANAQNPSTNNNHDQRPGQNPGMNNNHDQRPGQNPGMNNNHDQRPGQNPGMNNNHDQRPGQNPGYDQGHHAGGALISGDISGKIDYSVSGNVVDQLKLYLGDKQIYARDAATIVSKTTFTSNQRAAAKYLIVRLADPENADSILRIFTGSDCKEIADVGYQNKLNNARDPRYAARTVSPISNKIVYTYSSAALSQVKYFVGNGWVTASDAANILKSANAGDQKDIGLYLIERLADPENVNLLFSIVTYTSTKDALISAAQSKNIGSVQTRHPVVISGIPSKIDYSNTNSIPDQLKLYLGNNLITCADAAKIIKNTVYSSVQEKIAQITIPQLADPENINLLVNEVSSSITKESVIKLGINNMPSYHSRGGYGKDVARNIAGKIDYTYSSQTLLQVKLYLGDRRIYARDAADIIRETSAGVQDEVGIYLVEHLADLENVDLLLKEITYSSSKEKVLKAAMARR